MERRSITGTTIAKRIAAVVVCVAIALLAAAYFVPITDTAKLSGNAYRTDAADGAGTAYTISVDLCQRRYLLRDYHLDGTVTSSKCSGSIALTPGDGGKTRTFDLPLTAFFPRSEDTSFATLSSAGTETTFISGIMSHDESAMVISIDGVGQFAVPASTQEEADAITDRLGTITQHGD